MPELQKMLEVEMWKVVQEKLQQVPTAGQ